MRSTTLSSVAVSLVLLSFAPPAIAQSPSPAPVSACPSIYDFEKAGTDDPNAYILSLGSPIAQTVEASVTAYNGRSGYVARLPAVSIDRESETPRSRMRSTAVVLHVPPASDPPSILVRYPGLASCEPSGAVATDSGSQAGAPAQSAAYVTFHKALFDEALKAKAVALVANPSADLTCDMPVVRARVINAVSPRYPDLARRLQITGTSLAEVNIDATGAVTGAFTYRSSGNASLDEATIDAAEQSTFQAAVVACIPLSGSYIFRADFNR